MLTLLIATTLTAQPTLGFMGKIIATDNLGNPLTRMHLNVDRKPFWIKDAFLSMSSSNITLYGDTDLGYPKNHQASKQFFFFGATGDMYVQRTDKYIVVKERWNHAKSTRPQLQPDTDWRTLRLFDRNGKNLDKYDPAKVTGNYSATIDGTQYKYKIDRLSSGGMTITSSLNETTTSYPLHLENAYYGEYWLQNPEPNPEVPQFRAATIRFKQTGKTMSLTLTQFADSFTLTRK